MSEEEEQFWLGQEKLRREEELMREIERQEEYEKELGG